MPGGVEGFAKSALAVWQHVVGERDVCAARIDEDGSPRAGWLCNVVWTGADGGDYALPRRMSLWISHVALTFPN